MPEARQSYVDAVRAPASIVICAYTDHRFAALQIAVAKTVDQLLSADEVLVVIDHNAALMQRATDSFVGPSWRHVQSAADTSAGKCERARAVWRS